MSDRSQVLSQILRLGSTVLIIQVLLFSIPSIPRSQANVTTGWLDLIAYYAAAFKTGSYPIITKDRIFMWARLYPAEANANDSVGRPSGYQYVSRFHLLFPSSPAD